MEITQGQAMRKYLLETVAAAFFVLKITSLSMCEQVPYITHVEVRGQLYGAGSLSTLSGAGRRG